MDLRSKLLRCNFQCARCNNLYPHCKEIYYLSTKDRALNFKQTIYSEKRKARNIKSINKDLIFELMVADNIESSPNDILKLYNLNTNTKYEKAEIDKVNRIKRKIKSISINSDKSYTENYLANTNMKSFTIEELEIYIEAVHYLYTVKTFKLTYVNNAHKYITKTDNWLNLRKYLDIHPDTFRGNDIYFLASFCKGDKKKRNVCTRLFSFFNVKEAFSQADIDYILTNINLKHVINEQEFFSLLELINTLKSR